jgi:diguanylate cyclase (GGDEF)-like protein
MTIGRKLVLASVISMVLFGLLALTGWLGYRSVMESSRAAGAFERESMCLQMLYRGINETLLTAGTPSSIDITREAVECFDDAHALTLAVEPDESIRTGIIERVGLRWEAIRKKLGPYMKEGGVNHENTETMIEYGVLITDGEALMKEVRGMSMEAVRKMEETASHTKYYVILIWLLILFSMISLHLDLFRSIAVPLKRLRWLMAEISGDAELGRQKGREAGLLSERLTPRESRLAMRVTDIRELVASFDAMISAVNGHMDERRAAEGRLKQIASTDELTQAFNRSKFEEIIGKEMDRAARGRQPLSVIIFDIDRFKMVNDNFGHLTGDHVLRTLADIVRGHIRDSDYLVRWGGEEFLVVSPETGIQKAMMVAERLRKVMGEHMFDYMGPVTASFGVAEYREGETRDSFILRADTAMYNAKRIRNKVEQAA